MYYLYILKSIDYNRFYIGVTKDLTNRLNKHNHGSSKSTRPYRPWKLVYSEEYENKSNAYKREFYLKSPNGFLDKQKITSIYNHMERWPSG